MDLQRIVDREVNSSLSVLHYAISEDLPETAKEIGRWMSSIAFEFNRDLRENPKQMSFCSKPYILDEYQKQTGG